MNEIELKSGDGKVAAIVSAADMGIWVKLVAQPGQPNVTFYKDPSQGVVLAAYGDSTTDGGSYPFFAVSQSPDGDVRIQVTKSDGKVMNASLFDVLKQFS